MNRPVQIPENHPFTLIQMTPETPDKCLSIVAWNTTFENSDSRKRERLKFFYAPSGCDSRGYLALVSRFPQDRGMMAFGVFQAICQLSATFGRSLRGAFRNTDGSPMSLQQISCLLRMEICHLSAALEVLTDERVRWVEWIPCFSKSATRLPVNSGFVQGQGQGQGQGESKESARPLSESAEKPSGKPKSEPIPFPEFPDEEPGPSETASTRDLMAELMAKVNACCPPWNKRPHFTRAEMETLRGNAGVLASISDEDWAMLRAYQNCAIPESWGKFWQPDSRGKFMDSISDVLTHADKWKVRCRREGIKISGLDGKETKSA